MIKWKVYLVFKTIQFQTEYENERKMYNLINDFNILTHCLSIFHYSFWYLITCTRYAKNDICKNKLILCHSNFPSEHCIICLHIMYCLNFISKTIEKLIKLEEWRFAFKLFAFVRIKFASMILFLNYINFLSV